jgi:hypothetical protein
VYHGGNSGDETEIQTEILRSYRRPSGDLLLPFELRRSRLAARSGLGADKTTEEVRMAKRPSGRGSLALGKAAVAIKGNLKNAKIIDWHQLGTPNPEVIGGTVQTGIGNLKTNVGALTKLKELRDLNILIHGTPRPDIAQIKFTLRG